MKTLYKFGTIFLIALVLGSIISYTVAQQASTLIISEGVFPHGTYTFWREGSYYFAKNAYGFIASFGTNISQIAGTVMSSGGKAFFKDGIYLFDAPFIVYSNTTIEGESWNTVLQWNSADPASMTGIIRGFGADPDTDIIIRNIHIRGNGEATGSSHINLAGIYWNYAVSGFAVNRLTVENCKFTGKLERAIHAEDSTNCYLLYNYVYRLQKGGIGSVMSNSIIEGNIIEGRTSAEGGDNQIEIIGGTGGSRNITISKNHITYGINGIEIRIANNIKVIGNTIVRCSQNAITVGERNPSSSNAQPEGIEILNNKIIECGIAEMYSGIRYNATKGKVDNNYIWKTGDMGIYVKDSNGSTFNDNTIIDIGLNKSSTNVYGIAFDSDCVNNQVIGGIMRAETTSYFYAFSETDETSDYNTYVAIDAYYAISPCISGSGIHSNSHIIGCWNGTNWISTYP